MHTPVKKPRLEVKLLPSEFYNCPVEDLISLVVEMFERLIQHNDEIPPTLANTTRFHSRTPPGIGVKEYIERMNKYVIVEKSVLLMTLVFVDRMCTLYPTFTINSLTAHRFLIACVTATSKCVSDIYSTNAFFAKVGGISTQELNVIEIEFCKLLEWRLQCSAALLQEYYQNLIQTIPKFQREGGRDPTAAAALSPESPFRQNPYLDTEPVQV
ncbi:hypothetical protein HDV03_000626 [Kappamyces sp. JEL0829]|nr:hypothetical protein HDV03_000626 [Kappamyces sp. JEL0829]KAJ3345278.1 hypothetical protein HDU91_007403 [Kappamyces sp. JEL0680]